MCLILDSSKSHQVTSLTKHVVLLLQVLVFCRQDPSTHYNTAKHTTTPHQNTTTVQHTHKPQQTNTPTTRLCSNEPHGNAVQPVVLRLGALDRVGPSVKGMRGGMRCALIRVTAGPGLAGYPNMAQTTVNKAFRQYGCPWPDCLRLGCDGLGWAGGGLNGV